MVTDYDYKLIRVSRKNWELLRTKGHTPDSFDQIISKLLAQEDDSNAK